jgi:hypothetical protein
VRHAFDYSTAPAHVVNQGGQLAPVTFETLRMFVQCVHLPWVLTARFGSKARDSLSQSILLYFAFGFMDTRGKPSRSARRCFLRELFKLEAGRQNPCKEKGYRPKTGGLKSPVKKTPG